MTIAIRQTELDDPVAKAAQTLGRLGGRPKGSYSSPLAAWLRTEIQQRKSQGYQRREAFNILRDSEDPDGSEAFIVRDWTADEHGLDIGARVTWHYWRRLWQAE